ncbi:MAG: tRNA (adenosine(37)-N6)-threonylcarbamoyltransferase complex ATPase subunit type 1 TsaE [Bacteroidetes bacterium]|nr:tRNA (adenosine(37)-N6)-threonylcarbamoyltransferase complex ATPase subunit type 1 TsaE [Bacteroidota bacterium]
MNRLFYSNSLEDTYSIAAAFSKELERGNVIVFEGDLGVGKTEFIRAICNFMGIESPITSPTFTLINQYFSDKFAIYHIDLYRIKSQNELLNMGFQELFDDKDSIFFIEWCENSFDLIPTIDYKISIKHNNTELSRIIEIMRY